MSAAQYNIIIDQYQDFSRGFQLKEDNVILDITGYTFQAQVRERTQSSTAYNFTVSISDAVQGLITMTMTDDITATIAPGDYVYDLVAIKPGGEKIRLLQGLATVEAGVTR